MCGTKGKNRHDKSLEEDKFHVELAVLESRKIEGPRLNTTKGYCENSAPPGVSRTKIKTWETVEEIRLFGTNGLSIDMQQAWSLTNARSQGLVHQWK